MKQRTRNENGSRFDGRELARRLYGPPDPQREARSSGDPKLSLRPEYENLFGPTALSSGDATNDAPPVADDDQAQPSDRVPFDPHVSFHDLRAGCVAIGEYYGPPYERLLSSLRGVEPLARHEAEESRGASYKRLCAAAHMAGFSKRERKNLYWIAEKVGMSDRFAGHLIASLKKREGRADG